MPIRLTIECDSDSEVKRIFQLLKGEQLKVDSVQAPSDEQSLGFSRDFTDDDPAVLRKCAFDQIIDLRRSNG
ncbi:MAG: hypothetical protein H8E66_12045 [Planctomycetes bacterium]|nr:hypothetical protein [Planctomycetota bacterium]